MVNNSHYQIILMKSDETYFSEASNTNINAKLIYEQLIKGRPQALVDTYEEGEKELMKKPNVILYTNTYMAETSFTHYPCDIVGTKMTYGQSSNALPFAKGSHYVKVG